jgi:hypothetical protein
MLRLLMSLFLACCATPAIAAKPAQATAAHETTTLPGEYHLEGVMETGSGLLLRDDGTFAWFFSYGALDLFAKGKWQRAGNGIDLVVEDMGFPEQMPETKFERMHLRIDGKDLVPTWPWDMDAFRKGAERGAYSRED